MATISKINGIAIGSISKINGIAKASISKVDGISITVGPAWVTPTAIHSKCGEDATDPASNTIDGDLNTSWEHSLGHEHWIVFDLGETKTVQKVRLYCRSTVMVFRICEVSAVYINDTPGESGGSKGSLVLPPSGTQWYEIDVTDTSGRYIYLKLKTYSSGLNCDTSHGLTRFYEFEAYV
jgi:hypothetical protein